MHETSRRRRPAVVCGTRQAPILSGVVNPRGHPYPLAVGPAVSVSHGVTDGALIELRQGAPGAGGCVHSCHLFTRGETTGTRPPQNTWCVCRGTQAVGRGLASGRGCPGPFLVRPNAHATARRTRSTSSAWCFHLQRTPGTLRWCPWPTSTAASEPLRWWLRLLGARI